MILWAVYARLVRGSGRWFLHAWFALVGLSILTTYQHHFVDLPTGALLGALCLWVWPLSGPSPIQAPRLTRDPKRRRLAALYGAGALSLAFAPLAVIRPAMSAIDPAICANGWALWLLWPALSLLLVSFIYLAVGPTGFQKQDDGRLSPAATVLFLPYLIGTFINSRFWARHDPDASEVAPGVWLGRLPISLKGTPYTAILDLCAELPMPLRPGIRYRLTPLLDLAPPDPQILARGADFIASQRQLGPILVCCALGYGRSAAAVATWMVGNGLAPSAEAARAHLATLRPRVTLDAAALEAVHDGARIQV